MGTTHTDGEIFIPARVVRGLVAEMEEQRTTFGLMQIDPVTDLDTLGHLLAAFSGSRHGADSSPSVYSGDGESGSYLGFDLATDTPADVGAEVFGTDKHFEKIMSMLGQFPVTGDFTRKSADNGTTIYTFLAGDMTVERRPSRATRALAGRSA